MAELILNNLPIVLFVVITVAVRLLQSRAKARRTEAPPVFASALKLDDEENYEDENRAGPEALINDARTGGASVVAQMAPPAADRSRFEALPGLSVDERPILFPPAGFEPVLREVEKNPLAAPGTIKNTVPAAAREKGGGFPLLEHCTPPQRAVVWAELLGKPKGME
jgi:hypothetical protein